MLLKNDGRRRRRREKNLVSSSLFHPSKFREAQKREGNTKRREHIKRGRVFTAFACLQSSKPRCCHHEKEGDRFRLNCSLKSGWANICVSPLCFFRVLGHPSTIFFPSPRLMTLCVSRGEGVGKLLFLRLRRATFRNSSLAKEKKKKRKRNNKCSAEKEI